MKKTITTAILSILISFTTSAQFTLDYGEIAKREGMIYSILGGDEKNIFVTRYSGGTFYVEKYDAETLKDVFSVDCFKKTKEKKVYNDYLVTYYIGNKTVTLYTKLSEEKNSIYYKIIDADGNTGGDMELFTLSNSKLAKCNGCINSFATAISADLKHIAIGYSTEGSTQNFIVFNTETMKKEWESSFQLQEGTTATKFKITNEGLISFFNSKIPTETKTISTVSSTNKKPVTASLELKNNEKITSADYLIHGNSVTVAGFYKNEESGKKGVFSKTIELSTMSTKVNEAQLFTDEMIQTLDDNMKKQGLEPEKLSIKRNYTIDNVQQLNNNIYFVGQDFESVFSTTSNANGVFSQNVIYFKINMDGKIEWTGVIPFERKVQGEPNLMRLDVNTDLFAKIPTFILNNKLVIITGTESIYGFLQPTISSVTVNSISPENVVYSEDIGDEAENRIYQNAILYDVVGIPALVYAHKNKAYVYHNKKGENKMGRLQGK